MKEGKKKTTFLNQMALISQWERIQEWGWGFQVVQRSEVKYSWKHAGEVDNGTPNVLGHPGSQTISYTGKPCKYPTFNFHVPFLNKLHTAWKQNKQEQKRWQLRVQEWAELIQEYIIEEKFKGNSSLSKLSANSITRSWKIRDTAKALLLLTRKNGN